MDIVSVMQLASVALVDASPMASWRDPERLDLQWQPIDRDISSCDICSPAAGPPQVATSLWVWSLAFAVMLTGHKADMSTGCYSIHPSGRVWVSHHDRLCALCLSDIVVTCQDKNPPKRKYWNRYTVTFKRSVLPTSSHSNNLLE